MWSKKERHGILKILQSLSNDVLKSLARTVSKQQISCHSDEECIKVILTFEKSVEDFFRRKAISKQILTEYAYTENLQGIGVCESKDDIMKLISNYWSETEQQQTVQRSTKEANPQSSSSVRINVNNHHSTVTNNLYQINVQLPPQTPNIPGLNAQELDHQFGKTFCVWFFNMLNQPDPVSQGFGPSHFMSQAQMFSQYVTIGNLSENSYSNNIDISNSLLDLSRNVNFHPNVDPDGMKVKSDPHGFKLILVCGSLFKGTTLCGKFEQSFGLVKDPTVPDNWKIQVTALKCSETYGNVVPQLDDPSVERLAIGSLEKSLKRF